jgi:protocatechuate 3,4-dioxygenase beta subunit
MNMLVRITFVFSVSYLLVLAVAAQSRPTDLVAGNSMVSGRVTAQGRPLAGLAIGLQSPGIGASRTTGRARTDAEGRYRFTGLAAGTYQISPLNPLYVLPIESPMRIPGIAITIGESENVANVDLALIRGGVVTGRITDPEGRALIEQFVELDRLDEGNPLPSYDLNHFQFTTDDRGIYRVFGVLPGRYRVSAGEGDGSNLRTSGRKSYARTFHPDVTEVSQATIIEVGEGKEVTGIDIRLSAAVKTYTIAGRAIDAETNEPVMNITIFAGTVHSDGRMTKLFGAGAVATGGEFRIENLSRDRYRVYADSGPMTQSPNYGYSDPVPVNVVDADVTGVEIRVKRGGAISGVAVVEGVTDPEILTRLPKQRIAVVVPRESGLFPMEQLVQIARDGSFRVGGLRPGRASFNEALSHETPVGLTLLGVERAGVRVDSIEIGPGEEVSGIRIVFGYGNGIVRGQVIVKGGSLPEGAFFSVVARRSDGWRPKAARPDARGAFAVEGLLPGQYELEGQLFIPAPLPVEPRNRTTSKQTVTVMNGQISQVTLTIDLSQPQQKQ